MIVRIYGSNYHVENTLGALVKTAIYKTLDEIKAHAIEKKRPEFYTAYVVMMYVVSSTILKQMNVDNIKEIIAEVSDEKNKENAEAERKAAEEEEKEES